MQKIITSLIILFIFSTALVKAQTVDEIIDQHFDAVRQDVFNNVQTVIITSEIKTPEGLVTQKIYFKRPDKMKVEDTKNGITSITAYDGFNGWFKSPSENILKPELLTGKKLEETKFMANLDGYFFCYRNKGYEITFEGKEVIARKESFKMKCKTTPHDSTYIFVDTKTFLFSKIIKPDINKETFISDYRKINGIPFPFKFEINTNGIKSTQFVKIIQLDQNLPDDIFRMPAN